MIFIKKCWYCNHYIWPWQSRSPIEKNGAHSQCKSISMFIHLENSPDPAMVHAEMRDFQKLNNHGLNMQDCKLLFGGVGAITVEDEFLLMIKEKEDLVAAFPDQPRHAERLWSMRDLLDYANSKPWLT